MPKTRIAPTDDERKFAKTIVKESKGVRVTFGKTNGQTVFHLIGAGQSRTIKDAADWESCPLNQNFRFAQDDGVSVAREQEITSLNESIANRDAI